MPIESENPITAGTFDKWWVKSMLTNTNMQTGVVSVRVVYIRWDGSKFLAGSEKTVQIPDLFAYLQSNPTAAAAYGSLIDVLGAIGKDQEAIS